MRRWALFPFLAGALLLALAGACAPATPVPRPTPTTTPPPTPTPTLESASPVSAAAEADTKVGMWCDVWLNLEGPAGDPASRHPSFGFEAEVQGAEAAQVEIEAPSGKIFLVPPYHDIPYGRKQRFGSVGGPGLPEAGKPYTCTALRADGTPIPGAVAYDTYTGGAVPDPPTHVRAEVVADGVRVTWTASPAIPGTFDPGGEPPVGYYAVFLFDGNGELVYGWAGGSSPEPAHLIPFRHEAFGPDDSGLALETLKDGTYRVEVNARSVAPAGTAAQRDECWSKDNAQSVRLVVEKGRLRTETP